MVKPESSDRRGAPSTSDTKPHLLQVADAIRTLLAPYAEGDRAMILSELFEYKKCTSITTPKAGGVLGAIVRLIPQDRSWTIEDLKQSVEQKRVEASAKEIYNAVGYLKRRGHIRRTGYGRYVIDGVELVTSDDLGGESARHEDAYRVDRNGE